MYNPLNHFSHRKRSKKLYSYPSKDPRVALLDSIVLFFGIVGPLANVFQAFKIFTEQTAAGLSLFAWSFFVLVNLVWIVYAIVHKERLILISYIMWLLTNLLVVIGILMYG